MSNNFIGKDNDILLILQRHDKLLTKLLTRFNTFEEKHEN